MDEPLHEGQEVNRREFLKLTGVTGLGLAAGSVSSQYRAWTALAAPAGLALREADRVEITVLVDNYTDLLVIQSTDVVKRAVVLPTALLAEHGLSFLIKVHSGSHRHVVLFDAGLTPTSLLHNADVLKVNLREVESVVLSHGHFDHFGGLIPFLEKVGRKTPVILHSDAFLPRRANSPALRADLPTLAEGDLIAAGAVIHKRDRANTLASDLILATGEVERRTEFEKGAPGSEAKVNEQWIADPFRDDQALAVKVKGKGLVVISGCAHAGIINTVRYIQKLTATDKVHAVLGGLHLTGPAFGPIIGPTIGEMKKIDPDFLIPTHCTGWSATDQFGREMAERFVLNTVGTTYVF